MRNKLCLVLLAVLLNGSMIYGQTAPGSSSKKAWGTFSITTAMVPKDINISEGAPGWGGDFTLLFKTNRFRPALESPLWLGFDFSQHYFGTRKIDNYKVHYENWQLNFTARFTNTTAAPLKPFFDLHLGGRYLVSLTTEDRSYAGILALRAVDVGYAIASGGGSADLDYRILNEYGKASFEAGLSAGFMIPGKKHWTGPTFRASIFYGTNTHYVDCSSIKQANDAFYYPIRKGSGLMYSLQAGLSF